VETLLYVLSALLALSGLALGWLGWDSIREGRRAAVLEAKVAALESRQERLQTLVECLMSGSGWGDSRLLTKVHLESPKPF
jgi:hypothetical protein